MSLGLLVRRADRQMRKGRAGGWLSARGSPLPVTGAEAGGFGIMSVAGVVPDEMALKKQGLMLRDLLVSRAEAVLRGERFFGESCKILRRILPVRGWSVGAKSFLKTLGKILLKDFAVRDQLWVVPFFWQ